MYHMYDIMGPPGRRIARHVRDSSIPLTVDGTARRVPGKGPGTGSGRVGRRAAVLPGFAYFVSIRTRPTVAREPSLEVYRAVRDVRKGLVARMGGSPPVTNRSLCDTPLRRNLWPRELLNRLEL